MSDDQLTSADHHLKDLNAGEGAPVGLDTVRDDERDAIKNRRQKAGYTQPVPHNDLVGVALSGGGLRSAMFNLGLLQALQESGFMKYVDYLSTVSGGGYIGGFYSSIGHNLSAESPASGHRTTDAGTKPEAMPDNLQYIPELYRATHRFINAGQYLNQPWAFFAGYLFPSLAVFVLFFSGLVMTASLVALFLRTFDLPVVNDHLVLLNLNSEACALGVAIVSLWLAFMAVYLGIRMATRERRAAESTHGAKYGPLLKLLVIALLCGVAIMVGNYDFGLMSGASIQFQKDAQTPMIALSLLGVLALFRLPLLLRSEHQSATVWQKAALWVILSVAVGGSTLAVLSIIGSEGISGYASQRGPRLDHEDIVDNRAFAQWLKQWDDKVVKHPESKIGDIEKPISVKRDAKMITNGGFFDDVMALDQRYRDLFPDNLAWRGNPESILHIDDVRRSLRYLLRLLESNHEISLFLEKQTEVRELRNVFVDQLNNRIFCPVKDVAHRHWHFWDTDAKPLVSTQDLNNEPTKLLLAAFSNRVQAQAPKKAQGNVGVAAELTVPPLVATQVPTYAEGNAEESALQGADTPKPGDVRKDIVAYLQTTTNHASKPLLETDAFLKTLEPMIQSDGSLKYQDDSLDPIKELAFRRQLLELTDPHVFKQKAFLSTSVVVAKDQAARVWIFILSAISFVVLCCIVDFNKHAAVFQFYRERIARTFIEAGSRNRHDADMPLSRFAPWEKGFPYPLISAALKLPESVDINRHNARELDRNPAKVDGSVGSGWYSFLLSPKYVGYMPVGSGLADSQLSQSKMKTYRPTDAYLNNELRVSDAVTLSGAAFTPWMANNTALNLLMHVFNLRLEQWLPNPSTQECLDGKQPMKLWTIIRECIRCSTSEGVMHWKRGIVADGGFREFLGVEELIARRCRIIVVSDAGCNNGLSEFGVLADLVRQLRLDHDVRILDLDHDLPLDTQRMQRTPEGKGIQHFIAGRIRYPETDKHESLYQRTGLFVYVQMSMTGDEDIDLAQFQKLHPTFPDEPITNQFFTTDQVESLRQLGHHVGRHLCQRFDNERIKAAVRHKKTTVTGTVSPSHFNEAAPENTISQNELVKKQALESETRVERLADALVGAYLVECRQEQIIGKDDTPPDQPVIDGELDVAATEAFRDYEERGRSRRLAHFVTYVVDGFSPDDEPGVLDASPEILRLAEEIEAKELTGLAVECNRRHVGFRVENPDRFFRIGGRRLLLRSTTRAITLCDELLPGPRTSEQSGPLPVGSLPHSDAIANREDDRKFLLADASLLRILASVARLAATVPEGIFRSHGIETSRDLTLCVLSWIAGRTNEFGPLNDRLRGQINRRVFRRGLERAIRTRLAAEIHEFLKVSLIQQNSSDGLPTPTTGAKVRV